MNLLARPELAPLLLLAPLVLWLARRAARPPDVPIGTFELWQDVEELHGRAARAERRVPAWAWAAALACLWAALAAVGPRAPERPVGRTFTVWLDLSPSMHLPLGAGTRLDSALRTLGEVLARELAPGDRVRWRAQARAPLELVARELPRLEWLASAPAGEPEPDWAAEDAPGTLWVTDRAPDVARTRAGLIASGGPAVPGAIAGDGRELVFVDAAGQLTRVASPAEVGVLVRGAVPAVLQRALRAWAEARGYALEAHADGARLVLEAAEAEEGECVLFGPGYRAVGRGGAPEGTARGEEALWSVSGDAGRTRVALHARPGRLRVHLSELGEPEGDPAAFALACGRLFDRLALPRVEVVPLAERAAAGTAVVALGEPPEPAAEREPSRFEALAAGLAALAAACAVVLATRGTSRASRGDGALFG